MIPFWPPTGMCQQRLIDYVIKMGEGEHPATPTTKEDVDKCMEALRQRQIILEMNNVSGQVG